MSNLPENQVLEKEQSQSELAQSEEPEPLVAIKSYLLEEFMVLPLKDLEGLTGIDSSDWSRWFNGALMSERNLAKAAEPLGLTAGQMLDYVIQRRNKTASLRNSGRNFTPSEIRKVINQNRIVCDPPPARMESVCA